MTSPYQLVDIHTMQRTPVYAGSPGVKVESLWWFGWHCAVIVGWSLQASVSSGFLVTVLLLLVVQGRHGCLTVGSVVAFAEPRVVVMLLLLQDHYRQALLSCPGLQVGCCSCLLMLGAGL